MTLDIASERSGVGAAAGLDVPAVAPTPSPTAVKVHEFTFTIDQLSQAIETMLQAISGQQMVQWPEQAIIVPGADVRTGAHRIVQVTKRYSLEHGGMLYALAVLTMAPGETQ